MLMSLKYSSLTVNIVGLEIDLTKDDGLFNNFTLWMQKCELICHFKYALTPWKKASIYRQKTIDLKFTIVGAHKIYFNIHFKDTGFIGRAK